MAIEKRGTPEKIQNVVVAKEEFERKWAALKTQPVRCMSCNALIAKGSDGHMTIQKKGLSALIDGTGSAEIACPKCGAVSKLNF